MPPLLGLGQVRLIAAKGEAIFPSNPLIIAMDLLS
jgi:hypothetical protein